MRHQTSPTPPDVLAPAASVGTPLVVGGGNPASPNPRLDESGGAFLLLSRGRAGELRSRQARSRAQVQSPGPSHSPDPVSLCRLHSGTLDRHVATSGPRTPRRGHFSVSAKAQKQRSFAQVSVATGGGSGETC